MGRPTGRFWAAPVDLTRALGDDAGDFLGLGGVIVVGVDLVFLAFAATAGAGVTFLGGVTGGVTIFLGRPTGRFCEVSAVLAADLADGANGFLVLSGAILFLGGVDLGAIVFGLAAGLDVVFFVVGAVVVFLGLPTGRFLGV